MDIEKQLDKNPDENQKYHQGWLVTNTRFTDDALQYGKCAGLHLIAWDYPQQGSLRQRIDQSGLHPITAIHSLTKKEKSQLLEINAVLCRNLDRKQLERIGIKLNRIEKILEEAKALVAQR
jgi:hypothetical protein